MCEINVVECVCNKDSGKVRDVFFFQAEDGIRDAQESRGLGDVYKRQSMDSTDGLARGTEVEGMGQPISMPVGDGVKGRLFLSLIHI